MVQSKSWRWTQWTILFFTITFYIPVIFTRETYKRTILQRRAKALRLEGPPMLQFTFGGAIKHFLTSLIIRPAHMLVTEPIVTFVCLYNAFQFGLMYSFVVASPWIFQHVYDFDLTGQSLSFLGLIVGTAVAPIPLVLIDTFLYQPKLNSFRVDHSEDIPFPPEYRLIPSMFGSITLPTCLLLFAWTARSTIHWICPIVFQALTILSSLLVYASANLFMIDAYGPLYGASASGAAMLSRYTLSAVFPLFSIQMYEALGVGWATSLLAFIALAMAPIPWFFWRFGERLRARSRYEMSS